MSGTHVHAESKGEGIFEMQPLKAGEVLDGI